MSDLDLVWILIPVLVIAFAAAGLAWRRRRVGRWVRLLTTPTAEAMRELKIPSDKKTFPPGDTLFDFYYRQHSADFPLQRDTLVLALANAQFRHSQAPSPLPVVPALGGSTELTTEDKIKSLLGASSESAGLLPSDTLAENALINLINVLRGKKELGLGLEHALLDSLGAAGGLAGTKVGGVMGLISVSWLAGMALPFVALLVPALALIGGAMGALLGKRAGGWFKGWRQLLALRRMERVCRRFHHWFLSQFPRLFKDRRQEYERSLRLTRAALAKHQGRLARWFMPDLRSEFLKRSLSHLEKDYQKESLRLQALYQTLKRMDPLRLAGLLEELNLEATKLSTEAKRETPELWAHARAYHRAAAGIRQLQLPTEKRRAADRQSA